MNAVFVCFTGTGNTQRVCEAVAEAFRAMGNDARVELLRADRGTPDISGADRLIVAFPVHGFNAPAPVLAFLKGLPSVREGTAYLLRTSGSPRGRPPLSVGSNTPPHVSSGGASG